MSESIQEMENRWTLLMAARYPSDHHQFPHQRITDKDPKYAQECMRLRVEIEDRKKAETPGPQISLDQLRQLKAQEQWLERYKGTRTADGKMLYFEHSQQATSFRSRIDKAQKQLAAGIPLDPKVIEGAEAWLAQPVTVDVEVNGKVEKQTMPRAALGAPLPDQTAIRTARAAAGAGGLLPPSGAQNLGGGSIITHESKKS